MATVLSIPRLSKVSYLELDISDHRVTNHEVRRLTFLFPFRYFYPICHTTTVHLLFQMRMIASHKFDSLEVSQTDLSYVSQSVLADTLLHLRQTDCYSYNPASLLPLLATQTSRLDYLAVTEAELVTVRASTFARALAKLETVEISNLVEQDNHVEAVLTLLATGTTRVRRLLAGGTALEEVGVTDPPDLLTT